MAERGIRVLRPIFRAVRLLAAMMLLTDRAPTERRQAAALLVTRIGSNSVFTVFFFQGIGGKQKGRSRHPQFGVAPARSSRRILGHSVRAPNAGSTQEHCPATQTLDLRRSAVKGSQNPVVVPFDLHRSIAYLPDALDCNYAEA